MMKKNKILRILAIFLCFSLIFEQSCFAQVMAQLDIAGHLNALHNALTVDKFRPLHLRYLQYDTQSNNFNLLLDKGDLKNPNNSDLERTSKDLLKYFFVGISLPNDTFWVNLRPDSPDNTIDPLLAQTDVGRIMLEADLELKKDTAKATSPGTPEGRDYWNKLYQKAEELFGSQNVTIPTLTRPWIVPDEIIIRESTDSAYVYKATLKVMLEQDYLKNDAVYNFKDDRLKALNEYSSQLIRETIIPNLNKEINTSKKYAALRQVYYSLILSQWFKARFYGKGGTYSRIIDRKDLTNISSKESWTKDIYFKAYQKSFKDGEYNVQEPVSTPFGQVIRSYFSGGEIFGFSMPAFGAERVDARIGCRVVSIPAQAVNNPNVDNPHLAGMQVQSSNNPGEVVIKATPATEESTSPGYKSDLDMLKRRWKGKTVMTGREAEREANRAFAEYVRWFLNKYGPLADSKKLSIKLGMSEAEVDELRREMARTLATPVAVVLPARTEESALPQRAQAVLGRAISDVELAALQKAHEVGQGHYLGNQNPDGTFEKNEDPDLAYTPQEIAQKARILQQAGFSQEERERLIKHGVVGVNGAPNGKRKVADAMTAMKNTGTTELRDRLANIAQRKAQLENWKQQLERGELSEFAAIGDVHGDLERLKQMISELEAKGIRNFVFCGDFMDRGTENMAVFKFVKKLKEEGRAICLFGNHDLWLVQAMLGDPKMCGVWIANGGLEVLNELGIEVGDLQNLAARAMARRQHPAQAIMEHLDNNADRLMELFNAVRANPKLQEVAEWMQKNLQLFHVNKQGVLFVHAGIPLDREGNVLLEFKGFKGIEALKAMEGDLRKATSSADSIFDALNSPLAPVLVRKGWLDVIKREGVADKVLNQLGVNAIVFGHSPQEQLLDVENKIFGIDLALAKAMGGRGGNMVFGKDGLKLNRFVGNNLRSQSILAKEALLKELDARIADLEQGEKQEEAVQKAVAPAQTAKEEADYNDFIASLDEAEKRLVIGLVAAFEIQDIAAVRSFMSNGPLTADQYPTRTCVDTYLRLRSDINLFRLMRQVIIPQDAQNMQLYRAAAVSLRRKVDAFAEKVPAAKGILGLEALRETQRRLLASFISNLTPEEKKIIVAMSIAERVPAIARIVMSQDRSIEELGLEINPEIVNNYLQMREQDIEQFRVLREMIVPADKIDTYRRVIQGLVGKTDKLQEQLSTQKNENSPAAKEETIKGGLDSKERKLILAMVLALGGRIDEAVSILLQPGDAWEVTSDVANRYLDVREQDINKFRSTRNELGRRLRAISPESAVEYFGNSEDSVMNRLKLQKEQAVRRIVEMPNAMDGIIQHNIQMLFSNEFNGVYLNESVGGNAGKGFAGINGVMDRSGRIVAFGNPQDLRMREGLNSEERLSNGELFDFSILYKAYDTPENKNAPPYELASTGSFYKHEPPASAVQALLASVNEANKKAKLDNADIRKGSSSTVYHLGVGDNVSTMRKSLSGEAWITAGRFAYKVWVENNEGKMQRYSNKNGEALGRVRTFALNESFSVGMDSSNDYYIPSGGGLSSKHFTVKINRIAFGLNELEIENLSSDGTIIEMPSVQTTNQNGLNLRNRAEQVLGRPISDRELKAIQRAHEVGQGHILGNQNPDGTFDKNEDPDLAYTPQEIAQKVRILQEAGFNTEEREILIKYGIAGDSRIGRKGKSLIERGVATLKTWWEDRGKKGEDLDRERAMASQLSSVTEEDRSALNEIASNAIDRTIPLEVARGRVAVLEKVLINRKKYKLDYGFLDYCLPELNKIYEARPELFTSDSVRAFQVLINDWHGNPVYVEIGDVLGSVIANPSVDISLKQQVVGILEHSLENLDESVPQKYDGLAEALAHIAANPQAPAEISRMVTKFLIYLAGKKEYYWRSVGAARSALGKIVVSELVDEGIVKDILAFCESSLEGENSHANLVEIIGTISGFHPRLITQRTVSLLLNVRKSIKEYKTDDYFRRAVDDTLIKIEGDKFIGLLRSEALRSWQDDIFTGDALSRDFGTFLVVSLIISDNPQVKLKEIEKTLTIMLSIKDQLFIEHPGRVSEEGQLILKTLYENSNWQEFATEIVNICSRANDYNRPRLLGLLLGESPQIIKDKGFDFLGFLDFSGEVIAQESRLCLQVLEGVKSGIGQGLITQQDIKENRSEVISFVRLTHSFSPALFALYRQEGEPGLRDVFSFASKILSDEVGENELSELRSALESKGVKDIDEAILASIQIAIPSSGASFVRKEQIKGLLTKFREAGDKRGDLSPRLTGKDFGSGSNISLMEYALKPGETFDSQGKIKSIISALRQKHDGLSQEAIQQALRKDRESFRQALLSWFMDFSNQEKRQQALDRFYVWASHADLLKEKIDAINSDYSAVVLLEALFTDKDNLSILAREVLDTLDEANFPVATAPRQINNPKGIVRGILGVWSKAGLSLEEKESILQKMLIGCPKIELYEKVIPLIEDNALKEFILSLPEAGARISKAQVVESLFGSPYSVIQQEKSKFAVQQKGKLELEFRVVKGIPYGLWGLNAGVCIATDLSLWKNKHFFLLAIIDKSSGKVCGFVHLFETEEEGKRILTVPGIEPSVEFLSEAKAEDVFPLIEKALIKLAQEGGYSGVYLPTEKNILSNRSDIGEIATREYGSNIKSLSGAVSWNTIPHPYTFQKVYVMWEQTGRDDAGVAVKARQVLGRSISDEELIAIQRAHAVGQGHYLGTQNPDGSFEKNEDPNLAYTPEEIAQKVRILQQAGFTQDEREKIIKFGIAGRQAEAVTLEEVLQEKREAILSSINQHGIQSQRLLREKGTTTQVFGTSQAEDHGDYVFVKVASGRIVDEFHFLQAPDGLSIFHILLERDKSPVKGVDAIAVDRQRLSKQTIEERLKSGIVIIINPSTVDAKFGFKLGGYSRMRERMQEMIPGGIDSEAIAYVLAPKGLVDLARRTFDNRVKVIAVEEGDFTLRGFVGEPLVKAPNFTQAINEVLKEETTSMLVHAVALPTLEDVSDSSVSAESEKQTQDEGGVRAPELFSANGLNRKFANNEPILRIISDAQKAENRGDLEEAIRNYNMLVDASKGIADVMPEYKELLQFAQRKIAELKAGQPGGDDKSRGSGQGESFDSSQDRGDNGQPLGTRQGPSGAEGLTVPSTSPRAPGGIDFRALPIITQAISNLSINASRIPLSKLDNVNLDQELSDIQRMVNAGITPSAERIKEYMQASCAKGTAEQDISKVISCISDIMRLEEEKCCSTEPVLRDILVVLESSRSNTELNQVFLGKAI